MSAKVLTAEAAKEAKIELIDSGRGSQALHETVAAMRAARRRSPIRRAMTPSHQGGRTPTGPR